MNNLDKRYEIIFNNTHDALFLIRVDEGDNLYYELLNPTHERLTGLTTEEVRGKSPIELLGREAGEKIEANYRRCLKKKSTISYEEKLNLPRGVMIWDTRLSPVIVSGKVVQIVGSSRDITERKIVEEELKNREKKLAHAQKIAHLGSWELEIESGRTVWSDEFFRICGYQPQSFEPDVKKGLEIIHPDDRARAQKVLDEALSDKSNYKIEKRIVRPSGEVRHVLSEGEIVTDEDGNPVKIVGSFLDITERKEAEEKLKRLARIDPLTNLYNRRYMRDKIEEEVARFDRTERPFSLILGDIDFFRDFNNQHGHDCGDYVLKEVSKLMKENSRKHDVVARWGGEEFLILLTETDLNKADIFAKKLKQIIGDTTYEYQSKELSITMTFGVSSYSSEKEVEELIKEADLALYRGKEAGRNRVITYSS